MSSHNFHQCCLVLIVLLSALCHTTTLSASVYSPYNGKHHLCKQLFEQVLSHICSHNRLFHYESPSRLRRTVVESFDFSLLGNEIEQECCRRSCSRMELRNLCPVIFHPTTSTTPPTVSQESSEYNSSDEGPSTYYMESHEEETDIEMIDPVTEQTNRQDISGGAQDSYSDEFTHNNIYIY